MSANVALKFAVCLGMARTPALLRIVAAQAAMRPLLAALADAANDEHDSMLEWMGGPFDASGFSLADANAALQRVRSLLGA